MGDSPPAPTNVSAQEILGAFQNHYPGIATNVGKMMPYLAQQEYNAQSRVAPQYAALQNQLYKAYGPSMAGVGDTINRNSALTGARTNLDIQKGYGASAVNEALRTQEQADPEFFRNRAASGEALNQILQPKLSGGERSEVERSINRNNEARGTLNTPTSTSAVENAMTYGGALRDRLSGALNIASGVLPQLKSGIDTFQVASGRPAMPSAGEARFSGVTNPNQATGQGADIAGNFLGGLNQLTQQGAQLRADRRNDLDVVNQQWQGFTSFI